MRNTAHVGDIPARDRLGVIGKEEKARHLASARALDSRRVVDNEGTVEHFGFGMLFEGPRHALQPLRMHQIVVVEISDEIAPGRGETDIAGSTNAGAVARQRLAASIRQRGEQGRRPIGAAVVDDDSLPALIGLPLERFDGAGEIGAPIARRHDNGDKRLGGEPNLFDPIHHRAHAEARIHVFKGARRCRQASREQPQKPRGVGPSRQQLFPPRHPRNIGASPSGRQDH